MAEQGWGQGDDYRNYWGADAYGTDGNTTAGYYGQEQGGSVSVDYDANEYWRVDAEVYPIFLELAPGAQGASVDLGELPELCRRVGRPLQGDHEQFRLMQELDTTNAMIILRHDFVNWLLGEIHAQEQSRIEAEPRQVPVAAPAWEEVVQEVAETDVMLDSKPTVYYYNTLSGESIWELPSLVRCLWGHLEVQETAQQEARFSQDGVPSFVRSRRSDDGDDSREIVQQLRELFIKYDDDKSGYLDPAEFEDLCVRVGQTVNGREGLLALMQEVDPYSLPITAPDLSSEQPVVSWEALRYYWVANAPFQRRTRLGETSFSSWERVDLLHKRTAPVLFRHTATLQERWSHPGMEQRVVERLNHLFPSSKLDWAHKIDLFMDVQCQQQQQQQQDVMAGERVEKRQWTLETCWRVLTQLNHPMTRRQHVQHVMQQIQTRFGGFTTAEGSEAASLLDEAAMRAWLLYCTKKIDMGGWEEVFDAEGQTYYYHEIDGMTQWDPPQLQTQMTSMLSKLGGGQQSLSVDEQIARVFRQYDADESGEMTIDEFQHFYRALLGRGGTQGGPVSDVQIRQVFSVLDSSGDGAVSLEEFQFWWKTKLQIESKEANDVETITREQRRREICREFLENADAIVRSSSRIMIKDGVDVSRPDNEPDECFESNLLPRLVALLGEFPLRGLAYRRALNELVADPMDQLVSLDRFLVWYDHFETGEREKVELQRAKQRAQAELRAQHAAQVASREKQRRRRKQMRTLNVMNEQAAAITEYEAQQQREKKIAVLFKTFDTDGSGLLDENELLQLTKSLGHEMDAAQVSRMMKVMDSSGDGRINLEEFLAFWKAFEYRHPAAISAAVLNQTRRDAVSEPAAAVEPVPPLQHLTTSDAVASLAVSLEMIKDRALKLTLADLKGFLGDWRDDLLEKRIEQQAEHDEAEERKRWRELHAFIPTRKRVYGAKRLDVTWIEPEVVECAADIIADIRLHIDPPLKPDAAQRMQALARGHLARKHVLALVRTRFKKHIDPQTRLYYFTDIFTGHVLLTRPVDPTSTSSVVPFERDDCNSKAEKYHFDNRLAELRAKKRFYDSVCLSTLLHPKSDELNQSEKLKAVYQHRPMLAISAFYMYDVTTFVQQRLLGNIWAPLRSSKPELVLVELIARRRRRQLMQRGRDAAANLPLHYVVRHPQFTVPVVLAIVNGYPEALAECDAFGMTPLHIAFRERRSSIKLLKLLAQNPPRLINSGSTQHTSDKKSRKLAGRLNTSVWARQTVCGDTPLHVAILHHASVGVLQWALRMSAKEIKTSLRGLFNDHGDSAFHTCITQQRRQTVELTEGNEFLSPRSRTAILLFFKYFDKVALCSTATKQGDLPLHLAMDAFEELKQRMTDTSTLVLETGQSARRSSKEAAVGNSTMNFGAGWLWLMNLLLTHYPAAVLAPKRSNGLLPIHLAIKYGFPENITTKIFKLTVETLQKSKPNADLLTLTTIAGTRTTLLHYAIVHQSRATGLLLLLIDRMPESCGTSSISTGDLPIHVGAAARGLSLEVIHRLCDVHNEGCRTYNAKRRLPLHIAIMHDPGNIEKVVVLLRHCQEIILADTEENRGLRALLMAANTNIPDYRVLLALLNVTPSRKLVVSTGKAKPQRQPVTPLYALSLRHCTPEVTNQNVAKICHEKFEDFEDDEAYFLAMAKAKLRKQHYNPTPKWTFAKILELVERNPLDEAVILRSLHATNEKLRAMLNVEQQDNATNQDTRKGYGVVVDTVTLNSDLMLVRTVHQIMYEFPANPRLQLLGQAILSKLLPSAYVQAAYKAKIDPYFNL
ncbi:unnamed protein product [Phytophthora fragariaefolia]|uniref:Unnamed protein product n=1 Tax=Phytophthora fragariaefolia TaxID=1490495 RepID=A0A9W6YF62_9STRA|nr:unnamed protein product [Phytophthora fragariaefolia]